MILHTAALPVPVITCVTGEPDMFLREFQKKPKHIVKPKSESRHRYPPFRVYQSKLQQHSSLVTFKKPSQCHFPGRDVLHSVPNASAAMRKAEAEPIVAIPTFTADFQAGLPSFASLSSMIGGMMSARVPWATPPTCEVQKEFRFVVFHDFQGQSVYGFGFW